MLYVRKAIQRALSLPDQATGYAHAKDLGNYLTKIGFQIVNTTNYQNGDVVVMQASQSENGKQHPDGHCQIYYEGVWYSDFKQKAFSPYKDRHLPVFTVYRIK